MDYYGLLFLYYLKGLSGKSVLKLFFNVEVGGTEQLLPENTSTPTTTPILADIQYPDGLRTDQYFTYRETPTTISNKARIKTIKGQTLKWNQLIASNETVNLNCDSARTYNISTNNTRSVVGHKYCFATTITSDNTSGGLNCRFGSDFNVGKGVGRHFITFTANDANNASIYCYIQSNEESGTALSFGDSVLFDLTLMGLADKTDDEIKQWFADYFPLSYYDYNAGTLLSFNGTGIKIVGKNQINLGDSKSATANGITASYDASTQKITLSGTNTKTDSAYILINFTPSALPKFKIGETYVVSASSQIPTNTYFNLVYRDTNNALQGLSLAQIETRRAWRFTVPSNYSTFNSFQIGVLKEARQINGEFGVQLEFGSTATAYEPYTESVINLPISTYFPSGMKSIEPNQYATVEITDELIPTKATTRVGSITIDGNTPMNPNGATSVISAFIMPINGKANGRYNIMSDLFEVADGTLYAMLGRDGNNNVQFALPPSVPQTSAGGQAWFAEHPTTLYFELATPTETPITTEDANEALSLLMGKTVSSNNANQLINIITKGE